MLRQDEIPEEAEKRLRELLGHTGNFQLVRRDPANANEHDVVCLNMDVNVVILPCEEPIPAIAMARGVHHIMFDPKLKKWMELTEINPVWTEFQPLNSVE